MPADHRLFDSSSMTPPPAPETDAMTNNVETPSKRGSMRAHDRNGNPVFRVGDIVTRDGTDRQRVIETDAEGDHAPFTITVECIKEPVVEYCDGTFGEPWIRIGEREFNLARRYNYADDAIDGEATAITGYLRSGQQPSSS